LYKIMAVLTVIYSYGSEKQSVRNNHGTRIQKTETKCLSRIVRYTRKNYHSYTDIRRKLLGFRSHLQIKELSI